MTRVGSAIGVVCLVWGMCIASNAARGEQLAPRWEPLSQKISDVSVLDQDGHPLRFYTDLVKGRTVAVNFIFSSCRSVCPPLTTIFRKTQQALKERGRIDVKLISISVDPIVDRPAVLKRYAAQFGAEPGWTFVTGEKADIQRLLKSLHADTANPMDHTPLTLIGNDSTNRWTRSLGLTSPAALAGMIEAAIGAKPTASGGEIVKVAERSQRPLDTATAEKYFTNLSLVTHDAKPVRFYDDLVKGKVVLINSMFTGCTSICSPMTANLAKVQRYLGERVGRDIHIVSITVDPQNDTPEVLKRYAAKHGVASGWTFLTGKKENVDWVLYKLGAYVDDKLEHSTVLIAGNDTNGQWMKLVALDDPAKLATAVRKLADGGK